MVQISEPLSYNGANSFSLTIAFGLTANFISEREQLKPLKNEEDKRGKVIQEVAEKAQKRPSKNFA